VPNLLDKLLAKLKKAGSVLPLDLQKDGFEPFSLTIKYPRSSSGPMLQVTEPGRFDQIVVGVPVPITKFPLLVVPVMAEPRLIA
jgi:hypothetical protein